MIESDFPVYRAEDSSVISSDSVNFGTALMQTLVFLTLKKFAKAQSGQEKNWERQACLVDARLFKAHKMF